MEVSSFFALLVAVLLIPSSLASLPDWPLYDYSAPTECKVHAEEPLYNGGILKPEDLSVERIIRENGSRAALPAYVLQYLTPFTFYTFSSWVKIDGVKAANITAKLLAENTTRRCVGSVVAQRGCWSFLKGGFYLTAPSNLSLLYFQNTNDRDIKISITSASLQPFTPQQWKSHQQAKINSERKRTVMIHVSDKQGAKLQGVNITVEQISRDFPFGCSIIQDILVNSSYQKWFLERFNAAVFENELKWFNTEPKQGQINYTLADRMLEFVRANNIMARGHNIFWESPKYTPGWVKNLTGPELQSAINSRIESLMTKYKGQFTHWDVSNEMIHYHFYEQRLGPDASLEFFKTAHNADPSATLFMNDYNIIETCSDINCTVDTYILKMKELRRDGMLMGGIGSESHFEVPNPPLMRASLDKLSTLGLPIWLTELDISNKYNKDAQAVYLEQALREAFAHPSVDGIMIWSTLLPDGSCYQMCLTDKNFHNLPAGVVVDKLLKEWHTGVIDGQTDERGSYSFNGFLGEYKVTVVYNNKTENSTFSLSRGDETRHFTILI